MFLRRLRASFKADPAARGRIMSGVGAEAQYRFPDLGQIGGQEQYYVDSSLVYMAVSRIARAVATVNFYVLREPEHKRIVDHAIERLLRRPNAWQSQFELIESTFAFLALTGNAYWYLSGPENGAPDEIIPLRPDRVSVVAGPDSKTYIRGYVYTVNQTDIPLEPKSVLHFKLFHPRDDFRGLAPVMAASLPVQSDLAMSRWNRGWFAEGNGIPPNMVSVAPTITDTEFERLQEDFSRNYGATRERKTLFVRGGAITYTDIAKSQKDMDFLAGRTFNRDEVLLAYGIPPGMVDKSANRANAAAAREAFIEDTVWPLMVCFTQKLTADLCPYYGENLVVEAENIKPKDEVALHNEINTASRFMSVNEIRAKYYGLAPVAWGDQPSGDSAARGSDPTGLGDVVNSPVATDETDNPEV